MGIVQVSSTLEVASVIAAKVVAFGGHRSVAVSRFVVSDDAVPKSRGVGVGARFNTAAVGNAAAVAIAAVNSGAIPSEGAVVEHYRALVVDATATAVALTARLIAVDGAVVNCQRTGVVDTTAADVVAHRAVIADGAVVNGKCAFVIDSASVAIVTVDPTSAIAPNGGAVERDRAIVFDAATGRITTDGAVVNSQRPRVDDTGAAITKRHFGKDDAAGATGNGDHSATITASAIDDRRGGVRAD